MLCCGLLLEVEVEDGVTVGGLKRLIADSVSGIGSALGRSPSEGGGDSSGRGGVASDAVTNVATGITLRLIHLDDYGHGRAVADEDIVSRGDGDVAYQLFFEKEARPSPYVSACCEPLSLQVSMVQTQRARAAQPVMIDVTSALLALRPQVALAGASMPPVGQGCISTSAQGPHEASTPRTCSDLDLCTECMDVYIDDHDVDDDASGGVSSGPLSGEHGAGPQPPPLNTDQPRHAADCGEQLRKYMGARIGELWLIGIKEAYKRLAGEVRELALLHMLPDSWACRRCRDITTHRAVQHAPQMGRLVYFGADLHAPLEALQEKWIAGHRVPPCATGTATAATAAAAADQQYAAARFQTTYTTPNQLAALQLSCAKDKHKITPEDSYTSSKWRYIGAVRNLLRGAGGSGSCDATVELSACDSLAIPRVPRLSTTR